MSYQQVGEDEVDVGAAGNANLDITSDTAMVEVTVEKDTPEALFTFFGVTMCLNKPGLGLPAAFWDRLMAAIFASLIISVVMILTPAQMGRWQLMASTVPQQPRLARALPQKCQPRARALLQTV